MPFNLRQRTGLDLCILQSVQAQTYPWPVLMIRELYLPASRTFTCNKFMMVLLHPLTERCAGAMAD